MISFHDKFIERIDVAVKVATGFAEDGADARIVNMLNISGNGAILVNGEPTGEFFVQTADIEDEFAIEKDPDVVVAREFKMLSAVGGDLHWNAEMRGEMVIVAVLLSGFVVFGKVGDIVEWKDAFATVSVGIFASARKDGFTFVGFRFVGFVEPTVKIVGWLNGVVANNVF